MSNTVVCIWSDCACIYGDVTHLGIGIHTTVDGEFADEFSGSGYIGTGTVPTGEWIGLIAALKIANEVCKKYPNCKIKLFSDAQAVVRIFNKEYSNRNCLELYERAHRQSRKLGKSWSGLHWIPRTKNLNADLLSKQAIAHLQPEKIK